MERREEADAAQDNQEHERNRPRGPTKQVEQMTGGIKLASHVDPFRTTRFGRNGRLTRSKVNCRLPQVPAKSLCTSMQADMIRLR
jgi:hypothetical protein